VRLPSGRNLAFDALAGNPFDAIDAAAASLVGYFGLAVTAGAGRGLAVSPAPHARRERVLVRLAVSLCVVLLVMALLVVLPLVLA
jgi:hypothetical protein